MIPLPNVPPGEERRFWRTLNITNFITIAIVLAAVVVAWFVGHFAAWLTS